VVTEPCDLGEMQESGRALTRATLPEQVRERSFVNLGCPGTTLEFGRGVHETFRVNVRWVTPLGEDTASMS
jgi:hypothetical protein